MVILCWHVTSLATTSLPIVSPPANSDKW
jgi:hypothetical protein